MSIEDFDNYFKEGRKIVTVKDPARHVTTCHSCSEWWEVSVNWCVLRAIMEIKKISYCTVMSSESSGHFCYKYIMHKINV